MLRGNAHNSSNSNICFCIDKGLCLLLGRSLRVDREYPWTVLLRFFLCDHVQCAMCKPSLQGSLHFTHACDSVAKTSRSSCPLVYRNLRLGGPCMFLCTGSMVPQLQRLWCRARSGSTGFRRRFRRRFRRGFRRRLSQNQSF